MILTSEHVWLNFFAQVLLLLHACVVTALGVFIDVEVQLVRIYDLSNLNMINDTTVDANFAHTFRCWLCLLNASNSDLQRLLVCQPATHNTALTRHVTGTLFL